VTENDLRLLISLSCRILQNEGHEHFHLGHVSGRLPGTGRILVKPSGLGLQEIGSDDVVITDSEGLRIEGARPLHHEMPIHTEIYRARPDVCCVIHTHPLHAAALAAAAAHFKMVSQDSVLFADGVGVYPSAQLVVSREQGAELARCLGGRSAAILKNHGIVIAADSVQAATFLAVSFERSVRVQALAAALGPVSEIDPNEVETMTAYFNQSYEGRTDTAWQYLCRKLG
jgi:L-fuculose-phosphate aldolase